jgi:ribA/ribD-fused uncharacterized protein
MSDLLYNETPVPGKTKYSFGDWTTYAIHDENNIKGFFGDYRFLSNFGEGGVWFEGLYYPTRENAYQAAKVDLVFRDKFIDISPAQSKKDWKKYTLLDKSPYEWDERKIDVMNRVVFEFFGQNKEMRKRLIDTGNKYIEETNHWKDTCWGYDVNLKTGENRLGKLLMKVRDFYK